MKVFKPLVFSVAVVLGLLSVVNAQGTSDGTAGPTSTPPVAPTSSSTVPEPTSSSIVPPTTTEPVTSSIITSSSIASVQTTSTRVTTTPSTSTQTTSTIASVPILIIPTNPITRETSPGGVSGSQAGTVIGAILASTIVVVVIVWVVRRRLDKVDQAFVQPMIATPNMSDIEIGKSSEFIADPDCVIARPYLTVHQQREQRENLASGSQST